MTDFAGAKAAFFSGGMAGVEDEFRLMRRFHPRVPCFAAGSTGAAARFIHRRAPEYDLERKHWGELRETRLYGPPFRRILRDCAQRVGA